MARFNNGIIYTTENCIGCNKCISQCAILGANVSVVEEGVSKIQVDSKRCNHCGKCINLCLHGARDYKDDCDEFFNALESGEKLSIAVAPSFYILYPDLCYKILGYLKRIGVDKIYDVSFGADISTWGHVKYLKDHQNDLLHTRAFIANTCPAFVNVVEQYHPELHDRIIPFQSPLICTAIYAHKYLKDNNRIAFIGPCISKKDEIETKNTSENVSFNVTFKHLMQRISFEDISYYEAKPDLTSEDFGVLFPKSGSFKNIVQQFFPLGTNITEISGLAKDTFDTLALYRGRSYKEAQPLFVDVMACKQGCQQGPGIEKEKYNAERVASILAKKNQSVCNKLNAEVLTPDQKWEMFSKLFTNLNYDDFIRGYEDRYKQPFHIPENTFNEIFTEMLKNTEEKRRINCGSCGYQSCHEMAKAIAFGFNQKENCIHYMHDEMSNRFYTDKETGLPNRQLFLVMANKIIAENPNKQYVIISGDVNRLKVINDLYSFQTGNDVLKKIGYELITLCKKEDSFVARFGSGLFSIIMEYTPDNIQKIHSKKSFDCNDLGVKFPVTMRFGLYIKHDENDTVISMLNCATICMDKSVSMAQNTFTIFSDDFRERMKLEADITSKMQSALDNNEFKLWFQPQYQVGTKKLIGAETLCRWIKEDDSIVSPGIFIPIAEKNGFIRILDKFIWRTAFVTMKKWLDDGLDPVPISINISRVSLESDALIFVIKRLDDEFHIPPKYIHFEITESSYMADQKNMLYRIGEIRKLGYTIAMDDFGSGYSSLNSLKDIPIDILKLDMGFMRGESNIDKGVAIISAVVKMAQALQLTTIAEGVENEKQASFLESIECDIIQGFLYAKPMPEEDYYKIICNK